MRFEVDVGAKVSKATEEHRVMFEHRRSDVVVAETSSNCWLGEHAVVLVQMASDVKVGATRRN